MNESENEICVHHHFDAELLLSMPPDAAYHGIATTLELTAKMVAQLIEERRADRAAVERLISE